MTEARSTVRSGAERTRRCRARRKRGGVLIQFEVVGTALDGLITLGWLAANDRGNRSAVTDAIIRLAGGTIAGGIKRQ